MTEVGQVIRFDHRKGFGFIEVLNSQSSNYGRELFFHYSEIKCENIFKKVFPGEVVSFDVNKRDGKDVCVNIMGVHGSTMLIDNSMYTYKIIKKRNINNSEYNSVDNDSSNDEVQTKNA